MSVLFVPRSAWHTGAPTSNSGAARPRLAPQRPQMTRHYTGSKPIAKVRTYTAEQWMPIFQRTALASKKSFEYNYCIPPRADGSSQVWEYAGDYQAAHSAGENDIAVGVIFLIGVANHPSYVDYNPSLPTVWESLSDEMVEAYQWLRDEHLKPRGIVIPTVAEIEHRNMPAAATACPGFSVIWRDVDLDAPYQPTEAPMARYIVRNQDADPAPDFPSTCFQVVADYTAVRIEPEIFAKRAIDITKIEAVEPVEFDKYVILSGLPGVSAK